MFGEGGKGGGGKHSHDANVIKTLLPVLKYKINHGCEITHKYDIEIRKNPPSLTRGASTDAVLSWMASLRSVIDAQDAVRPVHAVIVHQDTDKEDPHLEGYTQLLKNLESMRAKKGRTNQAGTWKVFAVTPVRMTEAWWLLFPETVKTLAPGAWRDLKFARKPVESHQDPAGYLTSLTDRHTKGKRKYSKSDSPKIARKLADRIKNNLEPVNPVNPASASWDQFVDDVRSI